MSQLAQLMFRWRVSLLIAVIACLTFFGTRDDLVADSNEWIAMHSDLNVEDEISEFPCDVEFNPDWVSPRNIPLAPFRYHFSDVCYDFQRFPTQNKEPYSTIGKKLFEAYSALGIPKRTIRAFANHTAWEFECIQESRKLVTAHAWLSVNGNIFDSSKTAPDHDFWLNQPPEPGLTQDEFRLLVSQTIYTLKIESDSFFTYSDMEKHLTAPLSTWLGQTRFTQKDLEIINSFVRGLRMGFLTLNTMNISEWNIVHLANIHRTVCTHLKPEERGFIRTDGLMKTGERVCAPAGLEVPHLMHLYINWLHYTARRVQSGCVAPVRFALDAYLNLLFIHPWADCNGRMSRIVLIFILMKFELPPPTLEVSRDHFLDLLHDIQERAFAGDREAFYGTFVMWIWKSIWKAKAEALSARR